MTIEEQLREYRATLDAATEDAAASEKARVVAPPVRIRPARTLLVAAVAVAAAVAIAFVAGRASENRSTPPASPGISTTVAPPTTVGPPSRIVVPDVVGMKPLAAAETLSRFGFGMRQKTVTQCVADGLVVAQDPAPGAHVGPRTSVALKVCVHRRPVSATLPVVVCTTEYGVPPAAGDSKAPKSLTVANPPFDTPKLSGYSDLRGYLPVTAPAGWNCKALEATDGGQAVGVTPPGATPRDSWGVGGTVTQPPTDRVFASADPTCAGCVFGDVCAIVPGTASSFQGLTCPKAPAGQTVTPLGNNVYRIDDPAGALGPDAAHSILVYKPKSATTDAGDVRLTCILPPAQRNVCTALLNQFLTLPRAFS